MTTLRASCLVCVTAPSMRQEGGVRVGYDFLHHSREQGVCPYAEFAEETLVTHPNLYTAKQTHKICIAVISTTLVKREEGKEAGRKGK